jgi:hypothetical protein
MWCKRRYKCCEHCADYKLHPKDSHGIPCPRQMCIGNQEA